MPSEPRRCLIIDTETSELGHHAEAIEVGVVLYSITNQMPLVEFSTLLAASGNYSEKVNRIKPAGLEEIRQIARESDLSYLGHNLIGICLAQADVLVSYNVEFDARFFAPSSYYDMKNWPWLCAMSDFKWPSANRSQGSLIHLALDHGIGVSTAHRALTDCRIIAELFNRMTDLPTMFEMAMRPKACFQSLQPFEANYLAKEHGFKWDGQAKTWTRTMAIDDVGALPFDTRKLFNVSHLASDCVMRAKQPSDLLV